MKGYIYAVAVGSKKTKIGFSMRPKQRVMDVAKAFKGGELAEVYISDESPLAREWESKIKAHLKDFICTSDVYPTETFSIRIKDAIAEITKCKPSLDEESVAIEAQKSLISLSEFMLTDAGRDRFVSSISIASMLGKSHRDVLRVIGSIKSLRKYKANYVSPQNKILPCYEVDRDGMFLILMSFTGKNATEWKEWFATKYGSLAGELNLGFKMGD